MDPAEIAEFNRIRAEQGLSLLPVPGAAGPQFQEAASDEEEEAASTLETREAAAYENFKKIQDAEAAKKRREEKTAAIKKARDAAKRAEQLEGKGLGEPDEGEGADAKSWLMTQKKRQKRIEKARKLEEELAAAEAAAAAQVQYTSKDLAGVRVAHEISAFEDGDEQVLTLKDSNIIGGDDDDEGDELENIDLRDREKLSERLDLKKKKAVYDPLAAEEAGETSILAHYDEEISGKKAKRFTLDDQGTSSQARVAGGQPQDRKLQQINLDIFKDEQPSSDYLDISQVKVKKPKKKKKSARQRPLDEDDILPTAPVADDQSMDIDSGPISFGRKRKVEDTTLADDEDLQATLTKQRREALKKRKRVRPEDLARQMKEDSETPGPDNDEQSEQQGGLVIDETSEFISGLKKEDIEDRKQRKSKTPNPEAVTAMDDESDEDKPMVDRDEAEARQRETSAPAEEPVAGVDEEKTIGSGSGIGAALQLLRERNLIKDNNSSEMNDNLRHQQQFLAEKKRRELNIEHDARAQRERDRSSGKLDGMSAREREDWARQQNNMREQQSARQTVELYNRGYKPSFQLKYHDEGGRLLDQKEAFKHLSHQFHGKGSGKGKTDKYLKKIEDEKRRESQSVLDSSQNVGMSSAAAQQTKKRKEAGVRLQ
ncbi:U4/U6.U5 tri-snRNP-associated protein snu66 [Apiospora kogelbergensis]|uniref:U4/U6.U5 tri-snRNP-associated protein snu66 n=1 Tax=Apiospora kogelbergensis TaxID=1337665 RepID=A0AAW0R8C7_9PEZI